MPDFTMRIWVPGAISTSTVPSSSSISMIVPKMPPVVMTSSPTSTALTSACCARTRFCCGRISRK